MIQHTGDNTVQPSAPRYAFTVFTPTYNRAATLHRVYTSLQAQGFRDFEWLIVDDGSTDATRQLLERWQAEADFPIRYVWQGNTGKHVAFNRAVREAAGELFLPADSDDAFVPHALACFDAHWRAIPEERRAAFSGVTCLCLNTCGATIGDRFPNDVMDSNSLEMAYRYKVKGEKWGFHRTAVLRRFPFPEPQETKFVPEATVWHRIARHYQTRFANDALRVYYHDQGNQLTKNTALRAPPTRAYYAEVLNEEWDWFRVAPLAFLRAAALYARNGRLSGFSLGRQWRGLRSLAARALWLVGWVPGYAVAFFDRYRGNPLLGAAFGALRTVRAQRRPLRFLASRLLWRTGLCRRLVIDMGAYRLRFFPTALSAAYWIDPAERAADEAFITQALQAGDTLVDVGANIGALALAGAARVGVAGRVYAIEAHPRVFAYLQDNITLNGFSQMRVLHSAVGAMPGELAFSDQRSDDQNRVEEGGAIKVPVATLDALLRDHAGPIALLKIDVEGFERFVLQGARELLARTQCVFFESWDEHFHRYGYTTADLVADLRAQGFTLFRFAGDSFQALPPRYCSAYCENLVAARDVDALSQRLAGRYRLVSNGQ